MLLDVATSFWTVGAAAGDEVVADGYAIGAGVMAVLAVALVALQSSARVLLPTAPKPVVMGVPAATGPCCICHFCTAASVIKPK